MADLNAASVEDVAAFFKTYYAPNNAILSIVGDVDSKKTMALVDKYFGVDRLAAGARQRPDLKEPPHTAERRSTIDDPLARLARVDVAWVGPVAGLRRFRRARRPDRRAGRRSQRAAQSGTGSREADCHDGRIFFDESRGPSLFQTFATVAPGKNPADVEAALYDEIEKVKTTPIAGLGNREGAQQRAAQRRQRRAAARCSEPSSWAGCALLQRSQPDQHQH